MEEVVHISKQIHEAQQLGCQIAVVIGGGNILRGSQFKANKRSRRRSYRALHGHDGNDYQRAGFAGRFGNGGLQDSFDECD